jgi:hypothetical protein
MTIVYILILWAHSPRRIYIPKKNPDKGREAAAPSTIKEIQEVQEHLQRWCMWSSTVKLDEEKSKHAGLAQESGCGST